MAKGGYIGGSTTVGPRSGWFGYGGSPEHLPKERLRKPTPVKTPVEIEELRVRDAAKSEKRAAARGAKREKRLAAIEGHRIKEQKRLGAISIVRKRGDEILSTGTLAQTGDDPQS